MFKTDFWGAVKAHARDALGTLSLATLACGASAQTIGQLADAQRAKINEEILAATPAPAPAAAAKPARVMPSKAPDPVITVHAVYATGGRYVAELTDGRNLAMAMPGMGIGNAVVASIDAAGVHMTAAAQCKAKCPPQRLVPIGGRL